MNLETLKVFCDVVRCQSFSRGAALNKVSQSAASQAVHQLEQFFGVQLIDRSKRPFLLTPEGQLCHEGMRDVLDRFEETQSRIQSLRGEINGIVRVAAIYSIGLHDMSQAMQEFMTRYPKARVRLEFLRWNRVYEAVLDDAVDLGVISYPGEGKGISAIPLRDEAMVLVCHPEHRLARLKRVSLEELRGEDFVAFDKDLAIQRELDRFFRQHQVAVRIVMSFDNIETIKQAIEIGSGISILPEPTVRKEIQEGRLAAIPLAHAELRRPIGIVYRQRKIFTPTMNKLIELLREGQAKAAMAGAAAK